MESTIWFTDGFVVITGEIGSGKTTLIESFLKEIDQDVVVAQINQTQISPIEFLQGLLAQFGFSPFRMRKAELLDTLNNFLIEQYANGRKVLLIIDEAQNLTQQGAGGSAPALRRRNDQGEGAAHHPGGPARAACKARFGRTRPVAPARAAALPPERADRVGDGRLHPPSPQGGGCRGPRDLRAGHVPADLPLHGRHPAPHQHAVRHLPALRLRQQPGKGRRRDRAAGARRTAVAGIRRAHAHRPAGDPHRRYLAATAPAGGAGRALQAGRHARSRTAGAWPLHRRPHHRQRHADRQQVREPPPHAARHIRRQLLRRGPEQHQRRIPEWQARAPAQAAAGRRRSSWGCTKSRIRRVDLPVEPGDDTRATQTTVLQDSDYDRWMPTTTSRTTDDEERTSRLIRRLRADRNPTAWRGNRAASSRAAPRR